MEWCEKKYTSKRGKDNQVIFSIMNKEVYFFS